MSLTRPDQPPLVGIRFWAPAWSGKTLYCADGVTQRDENDRSQDTNKLDWHWEWWKFSQEKKLLMVSKYGWLLLLQIFFFTAILFCRASPRSTHLMSLWAPLAKTDMSLAPLTWCACGHLSQQNFRWLIDNVDGFVAGDRRNPPKIAANPNEFDWLKILACNCRKCVQITNHSFKYSAKSFPKTTHICFGTLTWAWYFHKIVLNFYSQNWHTLLKISNSNRNFLKYFTTQLAQNDVSKIFNAAVENLLFQLYLAQTLLLCRSPKVMGLTSGNNLQMSKSTSGNKLQVSNNGLLSDHYLQMSKKLGLTSGNNLQMFNHDDATSWDQTLSFMHGSKHFCLL